MALREKLLETMFVLDAELRSIAESSRGLVDREKALKQELEALKTAQKLYHAREIQSPNNA